MTAIVPPLRPERVVLRETIRAFRGYGIVLRRQNTGVVMISGRNGRLRPFRAGKPGDADTTSVIPGDGRRLDVEIKKEGWKPPKRGNALVRWRRQLDKLVELNRLGGVGLWINDPAQVHTVAPRLLEGWRVEFDGEGYPVLTDEPGTNRRS